MNVRKSAIGMTIFWLIAVLCSFGFNYYGAKRDRTAVAMTSARSFFQQIVITRQWNANHGGVYTFITENNQPNPYLDLVDRDLQLESGRRLTNINPAYMTRQISEIAEKNNGTHFHITSLKPIRPQNQPTEQEAEYLQRFETGLEEDGEFINRNGKTAFFYMAPLRADKACLQCHAKQGYKEGDIRGGISVTIPYEQPLPLVIIALSHLAIALLGLFGIVLVSRKLDDSYAIIQHQAVIDALTEIPNRRSFSESILREFDRSRRGGYPLTLIMCDIDNFKSFNDTHGHAAGDVCLKQVAQGIKNSLHRPGDLCARYGGEEFVVILAATKLSGGMKVAETIRSNIEKMQIAHSASPDSQVVTVSLGVSSLNLERPDTYEELIKRADTALYEAKRAGRNQARAFQE